MEQRSFLKKAEAAYFLPLGKRKGKDFYSEFNKLDAVPISCRISDSHLTLMHSAHDRCLHLFEVLKKLTFCVH